MEIFGDACFFTDVSTVSDISAQQMHWKDLRERHMWYRVPLHYSSGTFVIFEHAKFKREKLNLERMVDLVCLMSMYTRPAEGR